MNNLTYIIRHWLLKEEMTITDFAKELNVSRQYVTYILGGKIPPSAEFCSRVYNLTGITITKQSKQFIAKKGTIKDLAERIKAK